MSFALRDDDDRLLCVVLTDPDALRSAQWPPGMPVYGRPGRPGEGAARVLCVPAPWNQAFDSVWGAAEGENALSVGASSIRAAHIVARLREHMSAEALTLIALSGGLLASLDVHVPRWRVILPWTT